MDEDKKIEEKPNHEEHHVEGEHHEPSVPKHSEPHGHKEHHAEGEHQERHTETEHHEPSVPKHSEHSEHHPPLHVHPKAKKGITLWQIIAAVFAILFIAAVLTKGFSGSEQSQLSKEEAAKQVIDYINENLLSDGITAQLESVQEENGLYAINMTIGGQTIASYATKDGQLFFPQVFDTTVPIKVPTVEPTETPSVDTKSDKPEVELFVMSHCPYGTQAEKGILPAVEKLGSKIDFSIKFVYYAMHGKTEVDEQMNQVCIMNEQNDKYITYLKCFLSEGDGAGCLDSAGIDKAALKTCVADLDEEFSITANLNDQSTWLNGKFPLFDVYKAENTKYSVGGSPTLVINGAEASSGRSPAAYLAAVCAAFNTPPAECDSQLSTTTFSAGFGYTASDSAALAECG